MQLKIISEFSKADEQLHGAVIDLTDSINETYEHTKWYYDVFIPGLKKKERAIIAVVHDGKVLGCSLLKTDPKEPKICTLFVAPECRGQGLATLLMEKSLITLKQSPLITVSSRNISQLQKLLDHFNFALVDTVSGAYKAEDTEYYFKIPAAKFITQNNRPNKNFSFSKEK